MNPRTNQLACICFRALTALSFAFWCPVRSHADAGHWTTSANWSQGDRERYAVHMMLLRGDGNPYHSRILWYQGEAQIYPSTTATFYGGEWGWRSLSDTAVVFYPTANFDPLGLDTCGMNPFCGSHTILRDGRVLIAGGHNPFIFDYGDNRARIFTDGTHSAKGSWSVARNMNLWRWYPDRLPVLRARMTSVRQG